MLPPIYCGRFWQEPCPIVRRGGGELNDSSLSMSVNCNLFWWKREELQILLLRRYLAGADSQVALGAVVKGRAAAQKLNTTMQTTLPYVLGGDIFSLPMCFFTPSRRGDAPTGDADLPELDLALPSWFEPLQIGRFDTNDRWMEQGAP